MCTPYKFSILKVLRIYFFSKLVFPITLPWDTLLVYCQLLVVVGKAVCIIEQTPSYKTTRHNRQAIIIFRFACTCVILTSNIFQLLITPALHIPGKRRSSCEAKTTVKDKIHFRTVTIHTCVFLCMCIPMCAPINRIMMLLDKQTYMVFTR